MTKADPDEAAKIRRTYGRGFVDGLRSAGVIDIGEHMNSTKVQQLIQGQTSVARKILDVIPIKESWAMPEIMHELRRRGLNISFSVVQGCLNSLVDDHLVKTAGPGLYIRVTEKEKPVVVPALEQVMPKEEPKQKNAMDRLNELANKVDKLAQQAKELSVEAMQVTDEIEKHVAKIHEDYKNLKQLRDILKNIA